MAGRKLPKAIVAAALMASIYAVVLGIVVAVLLYELFGHHGHIGAEHLVGIAALGVTETAGLLIAGAVVLITGAYRLLFKKRRALLVTPLIILLTIGTIGEIADVIGTASSTSNVIGLGILLLAALPICLLFIPKQCRQWFTVQLPIMQ